MVDSKDIPILMVEVVGLTELSSLEQQRAIVKAFQATVTEPAHFFRPHADIWQEWQPRPDSNEYFFLFKSLTPAVALEYMRQIQVSLVQQPQSDLELRMVLATGNRGIDSKEVVYARGLVFEWLFQTEAEQEPSPRALAITKSFYRSLKRDPTIKDFPDSGQFDWRAISISAKDKSTHEYYVLDEAWQLPDTRPPEAADQQQLALIDLELHDFKNIQSLTIDLRCDSTLDGQWKCIAGINGSGKTTILQAIALLLLGRRRATELGGERLRKMQRRERNGTSTELKARLHFRGEDLEVSLPIGDDGIDEDRLHQNGESKQMEDLWKQMDDHLVVAYGATRNLSAYRDARHDSLSPEVRRLITLFDPASQIAKADAILGSDKDAPLRTLHNLLKTILKGNELGLDVDKDPFPKDQKHRLLFWTDPKTPLDADELPDGFRALVAWLADLCFTWHEIAPRDSDFPEDITGIVLIDEIDLHLHPSLQRILVPRLRKALPNVQWIVTTHSPLILSSFDRNELVVLDRDAEGGIRELDRQILGFTTDQVYRWLMGTEPYSAAIGEKLEREDDDVQLLLHQSDQLSEEDARKELLSWQRHVERLKARKKVG